MDTINTVDEYDGCVSTDHNHNSPFDMFFAALYQHIIVSS